MLLFESPALSLKSSGQKLFEAGTLCDTRSRLACPCLFVYQHLALSLMSLIQHVLLWLTKQETYVDPVERATFGYQGVMYASNVSGVNVVEG